MLELWNHATSPLFRLSVVMILLMIFIQYMKQKRCTDDDNDKTKDVCCADDYPPV